MKRQIIRIDEEKCNGCGLCIPECQEGALQLIDGKARLIGDLFCDGLGACIGHCPEGAITLEEREAEPYNERLVMQHIVRQGKNTVLAHLRHLKDHGAEEYLREAIAYIREHQIDLDVEPFISEVTAQPTHQHGHQHSVLYGCPGSAAMMNRNQYDEDQPESSTDQDTPSALRQWPVQMHLINPEAPCFQRADVVLAADCAPFAMGNFHHRFIKGKAIAIACPKLDDGQEIYLQKLIQMINLAEINTLTVVRMEVPCCGGLTHLARRAIQQSARKIPLKEVILSIRGKVIREEWL